MTPPGIRPALAFWLVVAVWATTPLTISWSVEGLSALWGLAGRLWLGLAVALPLLILVMRRPLPMDRKALGAYAAAALGIFGTMILVYHAAPHIPSGVLAVVFGLVPIMTSVLATLFLRERALTTPRIAGLALAFGGLLLVFRDQLDVAPGAWLGVLAVAAATVIHAGSTVLVKRQGDTLDGMTVTTGALLLVAPLLLVLILTFDPGVPPLPSWRTIASVAWLGIVGSVAGFMLYFHALRHLPASRMGLIPLMTPVLALALAMLFNAERFPPMTWAGFAAVIAGLALHESAPLRRWWPGRRLRW
ncbi:MAG: DMT family transporter [Halothiobacillaceae bacterium]